MATCLEFNVQKQNKIAQRQKKIHLLCSFDVFFVNFVSAGKTNKGGKFGTCQGKQKKIIIY